MNKTTVSWFSTLFIHFPSYIFVNIVPYMSFACVVVDSHMVSFTYRAFVCMFDACFVELFTNCVLRFRRCRCEDDCVFFVYVRFYFRDSGHVMKWMLYMLVIFVCQFFIRLMFVLGLCVFAFHCSNELAKVSKAPHINNTPNSPVCSYPYTLFGRRVEHRVSLFRHFAFKWVGWVAMKEMCSHGEICLMLIVCVDVLFRIQYDFKPRQQ